MFEGILEKFLLKYFGEYLKGIDKANLSVAVWKGEILVKTVDLNPEVLKKLGLPLALAYGRVDSMMMRIPWKDLSSKPVEVIIDSICVVATLEDISLWYSQKSYVEFCNALVLGVKSDMMKKLEEELEKQEKKSSFAGQIFDNLLVSVKNIQLRIESHLPGQKYTFGAVLADFSLNSVDSQGNPIFVKRTSPEDKVTKLISFRHLILYHDTRLLADKDQNVISFWFEQKTQNYHKILELNLDILFTLSPFPRSLMPKGQPVDPKALSSVSPVYDLRTEIGSVDVFFETITIRDMTKFLDYFTLYKQSKFDYLEKQKFNYLKPKTKIRECSNPAERKAAAREWLKFACKATRIKRRAKMSGVVLNEMRSEEKTKISQVLIKNLIMQIEGRLPKETEKELNWQIQLFNEKELTELMKTVSYEVFKTATNQKKKNPKLDNLNLEDINFFSVEDLPDTFAYLEFKAILQSSSVQIMSEGLTLKLGAASTVIEYKQNSSGSDTTLSIGSVQSSVEDQMTKLKEIICYGKSSGHDILNIFFKGEKHKKMVIGRIRRIHLYYKPELFKVLNSFSDVFEDGLDISGKLSNTTQAIIQASHIEETQKPGEQSSKGSSPLTSFPRADPSHDLKLHAAEDKVPFEDIINVNIEAPIVLIPQKRKLWLVDLGTFSISKAGLDKTKDSQTRLEGKETKIYFGRDDMVSELPNLNAMETQQTVLEALVEKMDLILSDFEFMVRLFTRQIREGKDVEAVELVCNPVSVDFVEGSLESFLGIMQAFSKDASREEKKIDRLLSKAEYTNIEPIEFNHGYEHWEQVFVIVESQSMHIVSQAKRLISTHHVSSFVSTKLADQDTSHKILCLQKPMKKLEFRSHTVSTLTELQYTLENKLNLIKEEAADKKGVNNVAATSMSSDFSISLNFKKLDVSIAGYSKKGVPFLLLLDESVYRSDFVDGEEKGTFALGCCKIIDRTTGIGIMNIRDPQTSDLESSILLSPSLKSRQPLSPVGAKSPTRQATSFETILPQNPALVYTFTYVEGSMESYIDMKSLDSIYKVEYVQSLLQLTDFIIEHAKNHEVHHKPANHDSGSAQSAQPQQQVALGNRHPVKISTLKSVLNVKLRSTKLQVYYKKDLHSIDILTTGIKAVVESEGDTMKVSGSVLGLGLYDLHDYPYREQLKKHGDLLDVPPTPQSQKANPYKSSMIKTTAQGSITFNVLTKGEQTEGEYLITGLELRWVQQQAMRLIDFLMFQVLEVFYPSLYSFSKHYSKEDIVRVALTDLTNPNYMKHKVSVTNSKIILPSTINPNSGLCLDVQAVKAFNEVFVTREKIVNRDNLTYFPFQGIDTEFWRVSVDSVILSLLDTAHQEITETKLAGPFKFTIDVDFVKKLFEWSFLYEIVEDVLKFDEKTEKKFRKEVPIASSGDVKQGLGMEELSRAAAVFTEKSTKERLLVNGRYNIVFRAPEVKLSLSNRLINRLNEVLANNINFDDRMDSVLRNTFEQNPDGIQIFMRIELDNVAAIVNDASKLDVEIFRLCTSQFRMEIDKKSNYVNDMKFSSGGLSATFGDSLGLPIHYLKFIDQRSDESVANSPFLMPNLSSPSTSMTLSHHTSDVYIEKNSPVWGSLRFTPDLKKEIEVTFDKARLIVFRFLLRFLPELLSLEPLVEHKGFEDPTGSKISILIKVNKAEMCIPSHQQSCLVLSSSVNYHITMGMHSMQHLISLGSAEISDCPERDYLDKGLTHVIRRPMSRPFDFNFIMRTVEHTNKTDYNVTAGNILVKLTAHNLKALSNVMEFQQQSEDLMLSYSLIKMAPGILANADLVQQGEIAAMVNFESLSLVYIDNYQKILLPVLRLDLKIRDFSFTYNLNAQLEVSVDVQANYNNSRTGKWEPFIEPLTVFSVSRLRENSLSINFSAGLEGASDGLYCNLTEELLEVVLHCKENVKAVFLGGEEDQVVSGSNSPIGGNDFKLAVGSQGEIHDSQFLIRNRTGYDFYVQTVGDQKGKIVQIGNSSERYVSFILNDEFSTNESINRDVILTFDPEVHLKAPIIFSVDKFNQVEYLANGYPIVITIIKEKLKRVAVISSKILIRNATSLNLSYILLDTEGVYSNQDLKPNYEDPQPIIFNKINKNLSVGLKGSLSEKINLASLLKARNAVKQIPLICAKESYNNVNLEITTEGLITYIVVKPALKIINYSPAPIEYCLRNNKAEDNNIIFRGKTIEVFRFDPYKEQCSLELTIMDVFRHTLDLNKFLNKGANYKEKLRFNSIEKNGQRLYLEAINKPYKNTLVIYSQFNVFNETGFPLDIRSFNNSLAESRKLLEAGDKNVLFIPSKKHDSFFVRLPPPNTPGANLTNKVNVGRGEYCIFPKKINCNIYQKIQISTEKEYTELNFAIIPKILKLEDDIITKTLTLSPKFVFVNETKFPLTIIQQQSNAMTNVGPQQRIPIIWKSQIKSISFQIDSRSADAQYLYTDYFEFEKPSYFELYISDLTYSHKLYLRVKISMLENTYYFQVNEIPKESLTTLVRNNTPFELQLRSPENKQEPIQKVPPKGVLHYAQCYPNKTGSLVDIRYKNATSEVVVLDLDFMIVSMDDPKYSEPDSQGLITQGTIGFFGDHKVVTISTKSLHSLARNTFNAHKEISITYAFNIIGISIMKLRDKKPRLELLNITLKNTEGAIINKDAVSYTLGGFVNEIQIDNNSTPSTNFPVILRRAQGKPSVDTQGNFLEWELSLEDPSKSTHLYLNEVSIGICPIEVCLEEEYLDQLIDFGTDIYDSIFTSFTKNKIDYLKKKYYDDFLGVPDGFRLDLLFWQNAHLDQKNNFVYLDKLQLPFIECYLSYFQDPSSTIEKDFDMVSLIGVAVGGFEEARIKIEGLEYEKLYQPLDVIVTDFTSHYRSQGLKAAYSIVGSLNILGNPAQIAREFSGGMDTMLENAKGSKAKKFVGGAGVLAKGTMAGFFGSFGNATGSIAGMFSLMTADKEFMKNRGSRKRKKAQNVLQGFEQGAVSLFTGITEGLAGVVMKPIQGGQKEGITGFFKGVGKGLTGLVAKPVSGVLDTISKAAEGIHASTRGSKPLPERARKPRAFYNLDQRMKVFNEDDAIYYSSLKSASSRTDELITSFNNLMTVPARNSGEQPHLAYLAMTTKFINILSDDKKVIQFELQKMQKFYRPETNIICFEYYPPNSTEMRRIFLQVIEGKYNAMQIIEEIHLQLSFILSKL